MGIPPREASISLGILVTDALALPLAFSCSILCIRTPIEKQSSKSSISSSFLFSPRLDDDASPEAVRRAAEVMLGQRKGSLDAKEAAVAAWFSSPERPKGASPLGDDASSCQFKAVDRVFYDAEAGLVYGRVRIVGVRLVGI